MDYLECIDFDHFIFPLFFGRLFDLVVSFFVYVSTISYSLKKTLVPIITTCSDMSLPHAVTRHYHRQ